jgi:hypothetical protein
MLHVSVQWAIMGHLFIKVMFLLSNAWWWFVLPKHVASNDNIKVLFVVLHSYSVPYFQVTNPVFGYLCIATVLTHSVVYLWNPPPPFFLWTLICRGSLWTKNTYFYGNGLRLGICRIFVEFGSSLRTFVKYGWVTWRSTEWHSYFTYGCK